MHILKEFEGEVRASGLRVQHDLCSGGSLNAGKKEKQRLDNSKA